MWIDSHAHVNDEAFWEDYRQVIDSALAQGVETVIVPGYDMPSSRLAVELAAREPILWAAVGIHPHDAKSWSPAVAFELAALIQTPRVVAVGEIGLDYYYNHSSQEEQRVALEAQLELAGQFQKPVIIHNRDAHQDTLTVLTGFAKQHPKFVETMVEQCGAWGVMHCFSGSVETAIQFVKLGLLISFAGALTFKNAVKLRDVAEKLPLSKLLVETDSPYLTPHPFRGRRNEPARVELVGEKLAEIKGLPVNEVMEATTANCKRLFGMG